MQLLDKTSGKMGWKNSLLDGKGENDDASRRKGKTNSLQIRSEVRLHPKKFSSNVDRLKCEYSFRGFCLRIL
jgi:hypothetical protein